MNIIRRPMKELKQWFEISNQTAVIYSNVWNKRTDLFINFWIKDVTIFLVLTEVTFNSKTEGELQILRPYFGKLVFIPKSHFLQVGQILLM